MFHLLFCRSQSLDFSILLNLLGDPDLEDIINDHNGKQHDSEDQGSTNHNHFIARLQYPLQVEVIDDHVFLVNAAGIRDFFYNRRNIIHRYICRIAQGKIDIVILDNFNVLPKDDAFFKEFVKNDFELLVTTRCEVKQYASIKIKEIASEKDLLQLFASHCPYSDDDNETVKQIIREVHSHTLTVVLSALSLAACGLDPDELLHELKLCGINITDSEDVELYKDGDYHDGLMIEHLRILMQISRLNSSQNEILKNLSILPISGVYKNHFRNWLQLATLHDVNYLAQYGFITDDIENKKISLHPLIQEIIYEELNPCISNCQTLVNSLHTICLMHGIEVRKPDNTIQAMISVAENIINDNSACYLLFLQDMFPYLEKYSVRDYMPKLADRISYVMEQEHIDSVCDRALLLDYKAELAYMRKDYDVAVKKREKAIHLLENEDDTMNTMNQKRYINLLSNLYNNLSKACQCKIFWRSI